MGLTIAEVKQNADHNLDPKNRFSAIGQQIGQMQLDNYNTAIKLGAKEDDDWYDWETKVEQARCKSI